MPTTSTEKKEWSLAQTKTEGNQGACPALRRRYSNHAGARRATDDRGYPRDEPDEAPAQPKSTVLRSTPNVQPSPFAEPLRAYPECNESDSLAIYETGSRAEQVAKRGALRPL